MANPTLQLHFGCGRATPPVSHSHNWPSGRMQNFLFKIGQKSYFFANKDPKTNFDHCMILQKHVLSFKCNDLFKMANLKPISSSATLNQLPYTINITAKHWNYWYSWTLHIILFQIEHLCVLLITVCCHGNFINFMQLLIAQWDESIIAKRRFHLRAVLVQQKIYFLRI